LQLELARPGQRSHSSFTVLREIHAEIESAVEGLLAVLREA